MLHVFQNALDILKNHMIGNGPKMHNHSLKGLGKILKIEWEFHRLHVDSSLQFYFSGVDAIADFTLKFGIWLLCLVFVVEVVLEMDIFPLVLQSLPQQGAKISLWDFLSSIILVIHHMITHNQYGPWEAIKYCKKINGAD